jgi:hypothetical protein
MPVDYGLPPSLPSGSDGLNGRSIPLAPALRASPNHPMNMTSAGASANLAVSETVGTANAAEGFLSEPGEVSRVVRQHSKYRR